MIWWSGTWHGNCSRIERKGASDERDDRGERHGPSFKEATFPPSTSLVFFGVVGGYLFDCFFDVCGCSGSKPRRMAGLSSLVQGNPTDASPQGDRGKNHIGHPVAR
jgi:hypothetical protein